MLESYLQWAATTGASFVPVWNNANVALVTLAAFTLLFAVAAFAGVEWFADLSFLGLVTGGILVAWPAMVVLSIAAVFIAVIVSFLHRGLMPQRSAEIEAQAQRDADARVEAFAQDLGEDDTMREILKQRGKK